MKYLLDTNIIIWLLAGDSSRITPKVHAALDKAESIHFSSASIWEIAIKTGLGKLSLDADEALRHLDGSFIKPLAIQPRHTLPIQRLPKIHADPFDRLLIAQATLEDMTLLTGDRQLKPYDQTGYIVKLIWDL